MKDQSQAEWLIQVFESFKKSSHRDSDGTPIHLAVVAELRRLLGERDALRADAGRLNVAVALLVACLDPLEIAAAIEDEDNERFENLRTSVRNFVEAMHIVRTDTARRKGDGWT